MYYINNLQTFHHNLRIFAQNSVQDHKLFNIPVVSVYS